MRLEVSNKKKLMVIRNVLGLVPFFLMFAVLIWHLALPDHTFSREEKRYLAQWPDWRIENLWDGSYERKFDSYFSDQFPMRNFWVQIQEGSEHILWRR